MADLVAGATERTPLEQSDGKSGAILDRVVIDGAPFVLKTVDRRHDWIMRQIGDLAVLPVVVWEEGLVDLVPRASTTRSSVRLVAPTARPCSSATSPPASCRLTTRPSSSTSISASSSTWPGSMPASWGWHDDVGLVPMSNRYLFFSPTALELELRRAHPAPVVELAADGWARLPDRSPDLASVVLPLLVGAVAAPRRARPRAAAPSCTAIGSSGTSGATPTAERSSSTGRCRGPVRPAPTSSTTSC